MTEHPSVWLPPSTPREAARQFVRQPSPAILLGALLLAGAARLGRGGFSPVDLLPAAALLVYWPLQEWLIHVFLLHARPFRVLGRSFDLGLARDHRAHHRNPEDPALIFIPLPSYLYSLPVLGLLWWLLTPRLELALTGATLHLLLALRYEWIHFLIHTRYRPRTRWSRRLWRNHLRHHFRNERHWYGVTMLAADRLLGTGGDERSVGLSPTCRTLGIDEAVASR